MAALYKSPSSASSVSRFSSVGNEDADAMHTRPHALPPKEDYLAYLAMVEKSEGFDVDYFPTLDNMLNIIHPIPRADLKDYAEMLEYCIELAIKTVFDETNEKLEFVKIVKANFVVRSPYSFYITFKAKSCGSSSKPKTYQTKVLYSNPKELSTVRLVRLKPEAAEGEDGSKVSSKTHFSSVIKRLLWGSNSNANSKQENKKKHHHHHLKTY